MTPNEQQQLLLQEGTAGGGTSAATAAAAILPLLPTFHYSRYEEDPDDMNTFVLETIDAVLEIIGDDPIDFGHQQHRTGRATLTTSTYNVQATTATDEVDDAYPTQ